MIKNLLILFAVGSSSAAVITIGVSVPQTGLYSNIGTSYLAGIKAAFSELNEVGPPNNLTADAKDDAYTIEGVSSNVQAFLNGKHIGVAGLFENAGGVFTALEGNSYTGLPIIGSMSGDISIRGRNFVLKGQTYTSAQEYFPRNFINIRGSRLDEAEAMIYLLTKIKSGITRVSVFYTNDDIGELGLTAVENSLRVNSLSVHTYGKYTPSDVPDVADALKNITRGHPQAICLFGEARASALFVAAARIVNPDLIFVTASTIDSATFSAGIRDASVSTSNIYAVQSVPQFNEPTSKLAKAYAASMNRFGPLISLNAMSYEGYIIGRFIGNVIRRLELSSMTISRENFIAEVYSSGIISLDDLILGPYGDSNCSIEGNGCRCNQGMRKVWLTQMGNDGLYSLVPNSDFQFVGCGIQYSFPKRVSFAFSADLTSNVARQYKYGLELAFMSENINGAAIDLVSNDDKGDRDNAMQFASGIAGNSVAVVLPMWSSEFDEVYKKLAERGIPVFNAPYYESTVPSIIQISPVFTDSVELLFLHAFQEASASLRAKPFYIVVMTKYSNFVNLIVNTIKTRYGIEIPSTNVNYKASENETIATLDGYIFVVGDVKFSISAMSQLNVANPGISGYLLPAPFVEPDDLVNIDPQIRGKTYLANNLPSFTKNFIIPAVKAFKTEVAYGLNMEVNQKTFVGYMTGLFIAEALRRTRNKTDSLELVNAIYGSHTFQFGQIVFEGFSSVIDENTGNIFTNTSAFLSLDYNDDYCNIGAPYTSIINLAATDNSTYPNSAFSDGDFNRVSRCSNKLRMVKLCHLAGRIILIVIAVIGVLASIASIIWIVIMRESNVVKAADYLMVNNVLYGVIVLFLQVILTNINISRNICVVTAWLGTAGFSMVFVTMLVKTYRILMVFDPKAKKNSLGTNKWVLHSIIASATIVVSIYYLVMGLVSPYSQRFVVQQSSNSLDCFQKDIAWTLAPILYQLIVLLLGIFVSIKSRKAWKAFNESKSNGLIIYNFFTATVVNLIIQFSGFNDPCTMNIISSFIALYNAVVILILTMFYKIKKRNLATIETPMAESRRMGSMDGIQFKARMGSMDGISGFKGSSSNLAGMVSQKSSRLFEKGDEQFGGRNSVADDDFSAKPKQAPSQLLMKKKHLGGLTSSASTSSVSSFDGMMS